MPKKSRYDKKNGGLNKLPGAPSSHRTRTIGNRFPRAIGELLNKSSAVTHMTRQLSIQQSWLQWLRETVPTELSRHIVHVVLKESELVVFADTSAWSVRLRYALGALAESVRQRDPAIVRVQVRVQPSMGSNA